MADARSIWRTDPEGVSVVLYSALLYAAVGVVSAIVLAFVSAVHFLSDRRRRSRPSSDEHEGWSGQDRRDPNNRREWSGPERRRAAA
jgi:hypothetical protein